MAETPFPPESGAESGAESGPTAPAEGDPGSGEAPEAAQQEAWGTPPPNASPEPESPLTETVGDTPAVPSAAAVTPEPPEPPAAPAPKEPAAGAPEPAGVAATIAVPALQEEPSGGGEWELLTNRISNWLASGELQRQWEQIRGPLKGLAIVLAAVLALRVYATVVSTIDAIPLVSGLLELAGLITVVQFCFTRLLRSSDRQEVLGQWRKRWLDFRGRD